MRPPSRRQLLGGGALLGAAWFTALVLGHRPHPGAASARLGTASLRTLEAAFEVLLPSEAPVAELAAEVDAFVGDGDPVAAEQLRLALALLEHLGGAGPLAFRRFSRLPVAARGEVLTAWRQSRIGTKRQIYQGVHKAAMFSWYSRPEAWSAISYDGPWVQR